jgi:hypothetical protein
MLIGLLRISVDPAAMTPLLVFVFPRAAFARPSPIFQIILQVVMRLARFAS